MAYLHQDDKLLVNDIISRKEFYWHKRWDTKKKEDKHSIIPRFLMDDAISRSGNLRLTSYQQFIQNYLNPNTPYKRILMKWQTGTGKSIGALSIAMNFIKYYRLEQEIGNTQIGSVFIIGFSERVFKNELLRFPEFGFLSKDEKYKLDKLKKMAAIGGKQDITRYHDMVVKIKKRFSNRKGNGFFKFFGYKAFVNRIFIASPDININDMNENEIKLALDSGKIIYNQELLDQFKNSLIICDEIHNVYNSLEKNNWGVAVQSVLDYEDTCRAVFASATPLNNSPTEIVDLLNLLLPKTQKVKRSDLFINAKKLKPDGLDRIAELSRGRISYLRDVNPQYYPRVKMHGDDLNAIPYLKFVRCPMSKFHYATYKKVYTGALAQDSQYLVDFALENPEDKNIGLYQTSTIKNLLAHAPQKWKNKYGLDFRDGRIIGDALKRNKLEKYSTKYAKMLDETNNVIKKSNGKIFIYHNIVHMSGVLFIEQVLKTNGFIDEFGSANDNTICMRCGQPKKSHHKSEIFMGGSATTNYKVSLEEEKLNDDKTVSAINKEKTISTMSEEKTMEEKINEDERFNKDEIQIIKKGKNKYCWIRNNKNMATIIKNKNKYDISAGSLDNDLINGKSYALRSFAGILDKLENIPIVVQVPHYAPRFGEWLLQLNFRISKQTTKYTYMILPAELYHGGAKQNNNKKQSKKSKSKSNNKKKQSKSTKNIRRKNKLSKQKVKVGMDAYDTKHKSFRHRFTPARYIIVHSDIDKSQMDHSIEKFNNPDNADGSNYMILIGSKVMKESFDIKAIQNVFIMGKPDNIPMLIQIRGRAIRKNSHRDLPYEKRQVNIKIFTSCIPEKQKSGIDKGKWKLSYEEEKYKDKIAAFKVMQSIEKVLHENAIDSVTNEDMINRKADGDDDVLDALPFNPAIDKKYLKERKSKELNRATFNIYHAQREVDIVKSMIKRFFIEMSSVWKYGDLLQMVKDDPLNYEPEINTQLIDTDNFIIALNQLSWENTNNYTEPIINNKPIKGGNEKYIGADETESDIDSNGIDYNNPHGIVEEVTGGFDSKTQNIVNKIYNAHDKIIVLPGGQSSIIIPMADGNEQFYILFPIDTNNNKPNIDLELPYRVINQHTSNVINMNSFVQTKRVDFDYDDKKKIFHRKYLDMSLENMENVVCEYGTTFHVKFIEECVEYVFNVWTNPNMLLSEYHEFYFKMIYYYDLLSLVMWAYTSKPRIFKAYTKYATPVKAKDVKLKILKKYEKRDDRIEEYTPDATSDLSTSGVVNLLRSSISRTSNVWVPQEFREEFQNILDESFQLFSGRKKKKTGIQKVSAKLLPIGHYIGKFPRIYHPERGWNEDPTYTQHDQEYIENDDIIGYDEKSKTGVHVRFKIRNPIHNIKKHKDSRLIEKGTVCKSKSKAYLRGVAKKIDINLPDKFNVDELCMLIRSKLIRLELKERIKKSKIKYFYFHYEEQLPR